MVHCQFMQRARFRGETYILDGIKSRPPPPVCNGDAYVGLTEVDDRLLTGLTHSRADPSTGRPARLGIFGSPTASRRSLRNHYWIVPPDIRHLAIAPLSDCPFDPDVFTIICTPRQATMASRALQYFTREATVGETGPARAPRAGWRPTSPASPVTPWGATASSAPWGWTRPRSACQSPASRCRPSARSSSSGARGGRRCSGRSLPTRRGSTSGSPARELTTLAPGSTSRWRTRMYRLKGSEPPTSPGLNEGRKKRKDSSVFHFTFFFQSLIWIIHLYLKA